MFNKIKNSAKISKSSSRLNSFTPKSNTSATAEVFDSTSQVSQKSNVSPVEPLSVSVKSASSEVQAPISLSPPKPESAPVSIPASVPEEPEQQPESFPAPSRTVPTKLNDSFPIPKPKVFSPKRQISSPKPEKVPKESSMPSAPSISNRFGGHKNKSSGSTNDSVGPTEPKHSLFKPIVPEPKTMAPVKPRDETTAKAPAKQLIVGSGVNVHADITEADVVVIEGTVDGTISADCLNILDGGIFTGEATCRIAFISGVFDGPQLITSERLEVGSTGKITASITYNVISMEAGSIVTGMLTHKPPPEPVPEPEPEPVAEVNVDDVEQANDSAKESAAVAETASEAKDEKEGDEPKKKEEKPTVETPAEKSDAPPLS